jgi:hypothetical protein
MSHIEAIFSLFQGLIWAAFWRPGYEEKVSTLNAKIALCDLDDRHNMRYMECTSRGGVLHLINENSATSIPPSLSSHRGYGLDGLNEAIQ